MDTLANSEDLDEMLQNAAFHQGLHCLLRKKAMFRDEKHLNAFPASHEFCRLLSHLNMF